MKTKTWKIEYDNWNTDKRESVIVRGTRVDCNARVRELAAACEMPITGLSHTISEVKG